MEQELITYRADDLPLLYAVIKTLGLGSIVNKYIKVHGNWDGTLPGEILGLFAHSVKKVKFINNVIT